MLERQAGNIFPCVLNGVLEFGTDFVVEDLEIDVLATVG
jgi:hypothetical protein